MNATEISIAMIAEDILAKEFTRVVNHYYPSVGELLLNCHVKVITCFWGRPARRLQYIGIYCSEEMLPLVQAKKEILREIADNMGLVQVVCMNAGRLLRDPLSPLKQNNPRLWLELHWVAAS
ncbi:MULTISPECIES: hypothetical protein [Calothrix]|uniref:Uncharacterized protein n=2 Tax=Calothrix TaxID=1186 RepID=A0ABR8AQM3_9CYAN|nr:MULTISPECIES: hypothetical protein [Calothrix]BAY63022.1 hypothetical protein NIES22_30980 [Calothrix brevissima NIES-22]MBD2200887.1 hypothetical protein [Calothrix parietina FACHB-288]MBD2202200.1 hypothetical protein [Calothrix sp. FACHB-168]MBD2217607.1 hypothetical protein [Calothrix sp. FACHB-1219]MBD2229905.1 hypothetical protein [Calothrix anomala FACHB-343]